MDEFNQKTKTDRYAVHRIWLTDDNNQILKVPEDCNIKGVKFLISPKRNMIIYCGVENLEYFNYYGVDGIKFFYGMTAKDSVEYIEKYIRELNSDFNSRNYFEKSEGNVIRTLGAMLIFAQVAPNGIWQGE